MAVIGFVVLGGALASVFPALIALTPVRLGAQRAHNVISWQVGAAAAGGAGLSAIIGLLIGTTSLAALGPAIVVLALILVAAELDARPPGADSRARNKPGQTWIVRGRRARTECAMTVQDIDRSTFEADWAAWHQRHEKLRAHPHGFLAITGLHWLTPEPQRFDDAPGAWSAGPWRQGHPG